MRTGVRACTNRRPTRLDGGTLRRAWRCGHMTDAEHTVQKAAANIPAEVSARFESADKLSDEDRKTIIEIARQASLLSNPSRTPKGYPKTPPPPPPPKKKNPQPEPTDGTPPSHTLQRNRRRQPRRSHERDHRNSAPKDQQCRRSPIVVRTMKALAASSIGQYEKSVRALADYYRAVELGLGACPRESGAAATIVKPKARPHAHAIGAIVFGSDQGLVGQFNDVVADLRSRPSRRCRQTPGLGGRRARSCASGRCGPAAGRTFHRAELRAGHHPACRANSN